jgi:hypothetical protein
MEDSIMKKTLLFLLTIAYCIAGNAIMPDNSWIVSNDGLMNCKKISVKNSKVRVLLFDGNYINVPMDKINSYSRDGKVFRKLNLYRNGEPTQKKEFMQLLKSRDGYCLYKYNPYDPRLPYGCYFIYKDDQFCYALDESMNQKRIINLLQYFGFRTVFEPQPA